MTIAQPALIITQSFNTWTVISYQKQAVKEWQLLGQNIMVTKGIQQQKWATSHSHLQLPLNN